MVKISDAVSVIVRDNLLYSLLISSGLINYTSLANRINGQVDSITGKKVKVNTIVKILTGFKVENTNVKTLDILRRSNLIAEYKYTERHFQSIEDFNEDIMLAVRDGDRYKCILKSREKSDLALIRVILPKESSGEPGLTLLITEYLNTVGLSVKNIYRLDTEIWITVSIAQAGIVLDRLGKFLYNS